MWISFAGRVTIREAQASASVCRIAQATTNEQGKDDASRKGSKTALRAAIGHL
ncbi:MAG: hypothetical protein ABI603_09135 [Acidobacteriota bacterium]